MIDHIWLAHFPKITYARHKKMAALFLNSTHLTEIELDDLCSIGIEPEIAHELIVWREKNPWEKIKQNLDDTETVAISINDSQYPKLLKQITDPPWAIFTRGKLPNDTNQMAVGVVGTRRHSLYGKESCIRLSEGIAKRNITVVSGLALGIDSFAHESAIKQNGITIAVLGAGVDRHAIYPRSHESLAEKIIKTGGALISEYPPGTEPTKFSFPARNRIIAGLTQGTLVIEAPVQSGALITARRALDYNREVMAVPHPINSISGAGGNDLIKKGAALITSTDDICDILSWQSVGPKQPKLIPDINLADNEILGYFSEEPNQLENIIQKSGLPSEKILSTLTMLEMQGNIKNLGGGYYIKN